MSLCSAFHPYASFFLLLMRALEMLQKSCRSIPLNSLTIWMEAPPSNSESSTKRYAQCLLLSLCLELSQPSFMQLAFCSMNQPLECTKWREGATLPYSPRGLKIAGWSAIYKRSYPRFFYACFDQVDKIRAESEGEKNFEKK